MSLRVAAPRLTGDAAALDIIRPYPDCSQNSSVDVTVLFCCIALMLCCCTNIKLCCVDAGVMCCCVDDLDW